MIKIKSAEELANTIDYTNLSNIASYKDIEKLCNHAKDYGFYSVVISPYYIEYAKSLLKDSNVKICTVVGFPLGFVDSDVKEKEVEIAIKKNVDEIDMVINIEALKSGDFDTIKREIESISSITKENNKILKVIIEAELLSDEELIKVSEIANVGGADFIKTSTGLSGQSPAVAKINLINKTVPHMKIKASGGIKNYKTAIKMLAAGADRLGTSSGDLIIEEYKRIYEKQLTE
ncbi:MAG: deoxyribose-phosphate aldolase [Methanobrevibacter sp.]|jgi:deoxyribose-phosphate aldolase|nr:deoxyribose-phosphate aldolase [Methanobrevibacter sp.]